MPCWWRWSRAAPTGSAESEPRRQNVNRACIDYDTAEDVHADMENDIFISSADEGFLSLYERESVDMLLASSSMKCYHDPS